MDHKNKDESEFQILMIPVFIINGIFSGMISVVTAYFFKPIWDKITKLWNKS
jgi:hypothetical protein